MEIQVPRSCLKEAKKIINALREAGKLLGETEKDHDESRNA
jgi:hypothetical protein